MKIELLFDGTDADNPKLYSWSKQRYMTAEDYLEDARKAATEEVAKFPGRGNYSREYNLSLAACKVLQNTVCKHVYLSFALPVQLGRKADDMPPEYAAYKECVSAFCKKFEKAALIMMYMLVELEANFPDAPNGLQIQLRMPYDQGGVPMSRLAHMRAVVALLRGENRVQTTEA